MWLLISLVNLYWFFETKLLLTVFITLNVYIGKDVKVGNLREIPVVCFHLSFARFAVVRYCLIKFAVRLVGQM